MRCVVGERQSLFDVAVRYCGTAEAAFDIALLNGVSLTEDLAAGAELVLPAVTDGRVVGYYATRGLQQATGMTDSEVGELVNGGEGIGFWAVECELVVS